MIIQTPQKTHKQLHHLTFLTFVSRNQFIWTVEIVTPLTHAFLIFNLVFFHVCFCFQDFWPSTQTLSVFTQIWEESAEKKISEFCFGSCSVDLFLLYFVDFSAMGLLFFGTYYFSVFWEVYPKVKVRVQREEADQYAFEKTSLQSLKAFEWLSLHHFSSSGFISFNNFLTQMYNLLLFFNFCLNFGHVLSYVVIGYLSCLDSWIFVRLGL